MDRLDMIEAIIRSVLCLDDSVDLTRLERATSADWDSVAHVNLIAALESQFGIFVPAAVAMQINGTDDIVRLLSSELSK